MEHKLDNLYDYLWEGLNRLDCEVRTARDAAARNYYTGMHMAYMNVLGLMWPEAASDRLRDVVERENYKTETKN